MIRPSQFRDSMMNKPTQGFIETVSPRQMHGLETSLCTTPTATLGRPVPGALPRYPHSEALQYNGTYFSYRLCGQDGGGGELPPAWSPSMAYLGNSSRSNSRSPMVPPAATEGSITGPIVYRQDKGSPHRAPHGSPLTASQELAAKRRHVASGYHIDRSQGKCGSPSVVTPSAVLRRPALAGANHSPQADGPVGLAVPKPVYGHSTCCLDSRCTAGHTYNNANMGMPRTPANIYEDEWLMGYGAMPLAPPRKELDMLLEQRDLHTGPGAERVVGKEVPSEEFCDLDPFLNRRLAVYGDAGHSSYSCSPSSSAPFFGAPPETCQRLPFPSREYPSLPLSHPHVYDPATLAQYGGPQKVYPEYPHAERYVQAPQPSRVYYPPQHHVETEKSPVCTANTRDKYNEGTPSPSPGRHVTPPSPVQYPLPQHIPPILANSPMHCRMRLPRHPVASRSFDHPGFRPYPAHLNGGQPKIPAVRPPLHPLPSRHPEKPLDYSLHRVQPESSQIQFPMHHTLLSGVVPLTPRTPEHSSPKLNRADSMKTPPGHYRSAPQFPGNINGKIGAFDKESPDTLDLKVHNGELLAKASNKRNLNTKDKISSGGAVGCGEDDDVYEVEVTPKKPKMDNTLEASTSPQSPLSPPMPVINQVFSLAPYKLYLEAAGVLPPVKRCRSADDCQEPPGKPKQDPEISAQNAKSQGRYNSHSATGVEEKRDAVSVKTEKSEAPKREDTKDDNLCNRKLVKSESCDAVLGGAEGERKSPQKNDVEADRQALVLAEAAVAKCKDEATSNRSTPTVNKDTKDSNPLSKPAVKPSTPPVAFTSKPAPSPTVNPIRVDLQNIPPQCLKLTTYNIVLPEVLRTSVRPAHLPPPPVLNPLPTVTQSPVEPAAPDVFLLRQARHQFMEMHQSLCRLLYDYATQTPSTELRDWLSKMELGNRTTYPPDKHQRVASLVGARAREVWVKDSERSLALQKVLSKLICYEARRECPFPHVIRAGGIFIPMLVVKEGLFPQVHDTFVDQVLQEHRVELRPTTLSEEKHLTQLQKRSCSSKLRRLLSLRHLPDIYVDVLNLFFFTSVCKVLDLVPDVSIKSEPEDLSDRGSALENSHLNSCLEESSQEYVKSLQIPEGICFMVKREPAERDTEVLSRSISAAPYSPHREEKREMVEEEWESLEEPKRWTIVNSLAGGEEEMEWEVSSGLSSIDSKEELNIKVELVPEEQEVLQQEQEEEEEKEQEQESVEELGSSWRGPVSSDNTCSEESDAERAESDSVYTPSCNSSSSSSSSSSWTKTQGGARSHSGVILKLRKVLSNGGEHGNLTLYQAVSDLTDPAVDGRGELQACQEERCQVGDRWRKRVRNRRQGQDRRDKDHERGRDESGDEERRRKRKRRRRERKRRRTRKEQSRSKRRERRERRRERLLRARALSPLDPTSSTTTTTQGSHERKIPKIRYCPYLSTCHSSDRRRRWVLRSAVQSARQAMQRAALPDLVGKRIRHLYEEKDKSEAWYRGVVLRVHEPHPNPLKTVFEVKYDSEPEWRYYLELLVDYQKGWLKVGEDF